MKWWKNRKTKEKKIEEIVDNLNCEQNADTLESKKEQSEHEVLEVCEQMIEMKRELEDAKAEYRVVTDYLKDVQKIKEISEEEFKELQEIAGNVSKLNRARDNYLHTTKKLSDAQFLQIQQDEKEIPEAIRRLEANETYVAATKRDMNYLEGEKQEWIYCMEGLKDEMHRLRGFSYVLFSIFAVMLAIILMLQLIWKIDTKWIFTLLVAAMAIGGFSVYFRVQHDRKMIKKCETNINHAITLSNKVKFKYVNTKNAVDYTCEKYHVHHSRELVYLWEQYQDALKEKEKYIQTNEDLEYYNFKLVGQLKQYQLYDAKVWLQNPEAINNPKEMVEVNHNLVGRRQRLRERIEYNTAAIEELRKEVEEYVKSQDKLVPELQEIICSIDSLSEV